DLASFPDCLTDEPEEFSDQFVCIDQFGLEYLPAGEGEKLPGELRSAIGGTPRGGCEPANLAIVRRPLDEVEIPRDDGKQVVEVVGNTTRQLADRLHFLALMKLLLDEVARLHSLLVRGDVSKEDCETFAGGKRVDRIP